MNVQGIRTEPGDLGQPYLGLAPGLRELGEISKVRKIHRETPTPKRDTGAADRGPVRRYPSKGNPSRIFLPIRPTIRSSRIRQRRDFSDLQRGGRPGLAYDIPAIGRASGQERGCPSGLI